MPVTMAKRISRTWLVRIDRSLPVTLAAIPHTPISVAMTFGLSQPDSPVSVVMATPGKKRGGPAT